MTIPAWLFSVALWAALVAIAGGTSFLLVVLVREWRGKTLW